MAIPITKHFSTDEFIHSDIAVENGFINLPQDYDACRVLFSNLVYVSYMLEIVRRCFGHPIRITSGYRCSELNKLVGGAKQSKHLDGLAVDVNCGKTLNKKLYRTIYNLKDVLPVDELINENNYSWIHVSFKKL